MLTETSEIQYQINLDFTILGEKVYSTSLFFVRFEGKLEYVKKYWNSIFSPWNSIFSLETGFVDNFLQIWKQKNPF